MTRALRSAGLRSAERFGWNVLGRVAATPRRVRVVARIFRCASLVARDAADLSALASQTCDASPRRPTHGRARHAVERARTVGRASVRCAAAASACQRCANPSLSKWA
jgi:hypothetical protein